MRDHAGFEKGRWPALGAIENLVDGDEIARGIVLAQRADRRHRQHIGAAEPLEHIDIGAGVEQVRRDMMAAAVARQEGELHPADMPGQHRV